jgi:hypothetical protein
MEFTYQGDFMLQFGRSSAAISAKSWRKCPLNNPGRRRSQTAYELALRGSATPVPPHIEKIPLTPLLAMPNATLW